MLLALSGFKNLEHNVIIDRNYCHHYENKTWDYALTPQWLYHDRDHPQQSIKHNSPDRNHRAFYTNQSEKVARNSVEGSGLNCLQHLGHFTFSEQASAPSKKGRKA